MYTHSVNSEKRQDNLHELEKENVELKKSNEILSQSNKFLKQTQKLLLESEEKFRNIFNLSPEGIIIFDNNNQILMHNDGVREIFGGEKINLKGRSWFEFCTEESIKVIKKSKKELEKYGISKNVEVNLKIENHLIPVKLDIGIMTDNSGQPFGKMVIISKKSEDKQIEFIQRAYEQLLKEKVEGLERTDKLKDEFISMASHELKTPLFPIKFQSKTLLDETYGQINEEQKNSLEEIYGNCKKMESLISDLLDLQKINLGRLSLDFQEIELKKFMTDVYNENKIFFDDKGIEFSNGTSDSLNFKSDTNRLKQVFKNLILNSLDFVSNDSGKIQISASHNENEITFLVKDNGIGIKKEDIDKIFEKFYKANFSQNREFGGSGLGLAICQGIIDILGGKIWVESSVGIGTTVYFQIPFNITN